MSKDAKDKRLRSAIVIEHRKQTILIDTGPDFRIQILRTTVKKIDAILFTHGHKDHIAGLDDIRAFCFNQQMTIPAFGNRDTCDAIKREFYYAFTTDPRFWMIDLVETTSETMYIDDLEIQPIWYTHGDMTVTGYRFEDFAYITDIKQITTTEKRKLLGCKILVLGALQRTSHHSHLNLHEAIDLARELKAQKTYITHISHRMGEHDQVSAILPSDVRLAYDGLTVVLD